MLSAKTSPRVMPTKFEVMLKLITKCKAFFSNHCYAIGTKQTKAQAEPSPVKNLIIKIPL